MRMIAQEREAAQVTYDFIGATLIDRAPRGFRHDQYEVILPSRADAFEVGVDALQQWAAHVRAGLRVEPREPPDEGATVAVAAPVGPVTAIAVCRVVRVVDEPDRFGFAYGTLPGHPERGEEAFVLERREDAVVFRVIAYSRRAELLARAGGPVTRRIQRSTSLRYLDGLVSFVSDA